MTREKVKGVRRWEYEGDHTFVRRFGPVKATIDRHWGLTPEPTEYRAFLSVGDEKFSVRIADLGVPWFEDEADVRAIKALEKLIKAYIRAWLK